MTFLSKPIHLFLIFFIVFTLANHASAQSDLVERGRQNLDGNVQPLPFYRILERSVLGPEDVRVMARHLKAHGESIYVNSRFSISYIGSLIRSLSISSRTACRTRSVNTSRSIPSARGGATMISAFVSPS